VVTTDVPDGWPATLTDGPVTLRPLRLRDGPSWSEVRRRNVRWLAPWEATPPDGTPMVQTSLATYVAMWRRLRREAATGRALPFAITYDRELVGQLTVGGIARGSLHSAHLGYWVDSRVAGRGIMPTAVALATDHCFWSAGLHRVEVNIRPENSVSARRGCANGSCTSTATGVIICPTRWCARTCPAGCSPGGIAAFAHLDENLTDTPPDVRDRACRRR
jgi:ribosomal-protein-alanine N-acetyltransferase